MITSPASSISTAATSGTTRLRAFEQFRYPLAALALFFLFVVCTGLGSRAFETRGEPREAIVAQAMLSTGNLVLPSSYGGDIPSKPPLLHWFIYLCARVLGVLDEATSRLPSVLASFIFVGVFCLFVTREFGRARAMVSAALLMTSIEWYRATVSCRVDMVLTSCFVGGLLAAYSWMKDKRWSVPWLAIGLFTLATLTKGPVSIALPAAILGAWLLLNRRSLREIAGRLLVVFVPVIAFSFAWYLLAYQRGGSPFYDKVYAENFGRFLGTMDEEGAPHKHSPFYLYATLLLGMLPWTPLLFAEIPAGIRMMRSMPRSFSGLRARAVEWFRGMSSFELLSFLAFFGVLAFYSLPASKRSVYILPAYPFLCFWIAARVLRNDSATDRTANLTAKVFAGAGILFTFGSVIVKVFGTELLAVVRDSELRGSLEEVGVLVGREFSSHPLASIFLLLLPGVVSILMLVSRSRGLLGESTVRLAAVWSSLLVAVNGALLPAYTQALSPRPLAEQISQTVPASTPLFSYEYEFYGVSFYLNRSIQRYHKGAHGLVLLKERDLELFAKSENVPLPKVVLRSFNPVTSISDHVVLIER